MSVQMSLREFCMQKLGSSQISVTDVYPNIEADDAREVEETVRRYLTVVRCVFDHIQRADPTILTELRRRARLRKQRAHR